jgi:hypothetical protein
LRKAGPVRSIPIEQVSFGTPDFNVGTVGLFLQVMRFDAGSESTPRASLEHLFRDLEVIVETLVEAGH